jgi:hypothetical protein
MLHPRWLGLRRRRRPACSPRVYAARRSVCHLLGAAAIAVVVGNRMRITSGALSRRSTGVLRSWRPPVPADYPGQYGSSGPQVYCGPAGPPAPDQANTSCSVPGVLRSWRPTSSRPVSQPVRFARSPGILPSWRLTSSTPVSRPVRVFWFGDVLRLPRPLTPRPLS